MSKEPNNPSNPPLFTDMERKEALNFKKTKKISPEDQRKLSDVEKILWMFGGKFANRLKVKKYQGSIATQVDKYTAVRKEVSPSISLIQINVIIKNKKAIIDFPDGITILKIKELIANELKIPISEVKICFLGKNLADDKVINKAFFEGKNPELLIDYPEPVLVNNNSQIEPPIKSSTNNKKEENKSTFAHSSSWIQVKLISKKQNQSVKFPDGIQIIQIKKLIANELKIPISEVKICFLGKNLADDKVINKAFFNGKDPELVIDYSEPDKVNIKSPEELPIKSLTNNKEEEKKSTLRKNKSAAENDKSPPDKIIISHKNIYYINFYKNKPEINEINLKNVNSYDLFSIDAHPGETIWALKERIAKKYQVPFDSIQIKYNGEFLKDDKILEIENYLKKYIEVYSSYDFSIKKEISATVLNGNQEYKNNSNNDKSDTQSAIDKLAQLLPNIEWKIIEDQNKKYLGGDISKLVVNSFEKMVLRSIIQEGLGIDAQLVPDIGRNNFFKIEAKDNVIDAIKSLEKNKFNDLPAVKTEIDTIWNKTKDQLKDYFKKNNGGNFFTLIFYINNDLALINKQLGNTADTLLSLANEDFFEKPISDFFKKIHQNYLISNNNLPAISENIASLPEVHKEKKLEANDYIEENKIANEALENIKKLIPALEWKLSYTQDKKAYLNGIFKITQIYNSSSASNYPAVMADLIKELLDTKNEIYNPHINSNICLFDCETNENNAKINFQKIRNLTKEQLEKKVNIQWEKLRFRGSVNITENLKALISFNPQLVNKRISAVNRVKHYTPLTILLSYPKPDVDAAEYLIKQGGKIEEIDFALLSKEGKQFLEKKYSEKLEIIKQNYENEKNNLYESIFIEYSDNSFKFTHIPIMVYYGESFKHLKERIAKEFNLPFHAIVLTNTTTNTTFEDNDILNNIINNKNTFLKLTCNNPVFSQADTDSSDLSLPSAPPLENKKLYWRIREKSPFEGGRYQTDDQDIYTITVCDKYEDAIKAIQIKCINNLKSNDPQAENYEYFIEAIEILEEDFLQQYCDEYHSLAKNISLKNKSSLSFGTIGFSDYFYDNNSNEFKLSEFTELGKSNWSQFIDTELYYHTLNNCFQEESAPLVEDETRSFFEKIKEFKENLFWAFNNGNRAVINSLINSAIESNNKDFLNILTHLFVEGKVKGYSPIHLLVHWGQNDLIKKLIQKNIDFNVRDIRGHLPCYYAVDYLDNPTATLLYDEGIIFKEFHPNLSVPTRTKLSHENTQVSVKIVIHTLYGFSITISTKFDSTIKEIKEMAAKEINENFLKANSFQKVFSEDLRLICKGISCPDTTVVKDYPFVINPFYAVEQKVENKQLNSANIIIEEPHYKYYIIVQNFYNDENIVGSKLLNIDDAIELSIISDLADLDNIYNAWKTRNEKNKTKINVSNPGSLFIRPQAILALIRVEEKAAESLTIEKNVTNAVNSIVLDGENNIPYEALCYGFPNGNMVVPPVSHDKILNQHVNTFRKIVNKNLNEYNAGFNSKTYAEYNYGLLKSYIIEVLERAFEELNSKDKYSLYEHLEYITSHQNELYFIQKLAEKNAALLELHLTLSQPQVIMCGMLFSQIEDAKKFGIEQLKSWLITYENKIEVSLEYQNKIKASHDVLRESWRTQASEKHAQTVPVSVPNPNLSTGLKNKSDFDVLKNRWDNIWNKKANWFDKLGGDQLLIDRHKNNFFEILNNKYVTQIDKLFLDNTTDEYEKLKQIYENTQSWLAQRFISYQVPDHTYQSMKYFGRYANSLLFKYADVNAKTEDSSIIVDDSNIKKATNIEAVQTQTPEQNLKEALEAFEKCLEKIDISHYTGLDLIIKSLSGSQIDSNNIDYSGRYLKIQDICDERLETSNLFKKAKWTLTKHFGRPPEVEAIYKFFKETPLMIKDDSNNYVLNAEGIAKLIPLITNLENLINNKPDLPKKINK